MQPTVRGCNGNKSCSSAAGKSKPVRKKPAAGRKKQNDAGKHNNAGGKKQNGRRNNAGGKRGLHGEEPVGQVGGSKNGRQHLTTTMKI